MNLSNKQYDKAKTIVTIWVPAIMTAISGLGVLWGFESALIVGTIGILATSAGAILKVSTDNYNKEDEE